jgi:hypothetical protein
MKQFWRSRIVDCGLRAFLQTFASWFRKALQNHFVLVGPEEHVELRGPRRRAGALWWNGTTAQRAEIDAEIERRSADAYRRAGAPSGRG